MNKVIGKKYCKKVFLPKELTQIVDNMEKM